MELHIWGLRTPPPAEHLDLVPPYMGTAWALGAIAIGLVQGQSIGFDEIPAALPPGIPFANAASVHETSTAEIALALTLAAQRQLPRFVRAQDRGGWHPVFAESLADCCVLLIGFGGVGTAIAQRLAPFEVEVTAVARTARTEAVDGIGRVAVHGMDELPALLPEAEIVVLSLGCRHLFGAGMMARMADGALLVNAGRSSVVDTGALLPELQRGRLRAALDVFEEEPASAGHPLWSASNLLIAPHVDGATTAVNPRIARLVRAQIDRMLASRR